MPCSRPLWNRWGLGRRPDLYPEPEKFRPERFLERKYSGHEWFPFGGGNRTCLGMAFALYEMKVVLATLFSQATFTHPPGMQSAPIRRGLSLAPDDGVTVIMSRNQETGVRNQKASIGSLVPDS